MNKLTNTLILTITAIVMIVFSNWFIHKESVAPVINLIGCLILTREIMLTFSKDSKKVIVWAYIGIAACLIAVLIDLILLTL